MTILDKITSNSDNWRLGKNDGKQRQLANILDKGTPDNHIWQLSLDKITSYNDKYHLFYTQCRQLSTILDKITSNNDNLQILLEKMTFSNDI